MKPNEKKDSEQSLGNRARLGDLMPGQTGIISHVHDTENPTMTLRLLEMGLLEGGTVEVLHQAPFTRDPIAVRVRGALIALRREEANWVEVQLS